MREIEIVEKFMNKMEFRNYVSTMFYYKHYNPITIDDVRHSDGIEINDNDIIVAKDGVKYTVQTFRNGNIGESHIKQTIKDMEKENVNHGIIVTNYHVKQDIKDKAFEKNITILDYSDLENGIY